MDQDGWLVVAGLAAVLAPPAVLAVLLPRRWLRRGVLAWLALPVVAYLGVAAWAVVTQSGTPRLGHDLMLGASLLGAFGAVPWLLASGLGFGLGFALRWLLRPAERQAPPMAGLPAGRRWLLVALALAAGLLVFGMLRPLGLP